MAKTMKKNITAVFALILSLLVTFPSMASEEGNDTQFSYFTLEPEITTNFITEGRKLGFINVRVDLMVDDPSLLQMLEYHQPLIRDAIIEMLSQENEVRIKSLSGRESIRKACLDKVNAMLLAETNQKVLTDLLFTKYLYQ
ncbi:flagellar biosynthesis protein FliL [Grimontia hollisae CIP 101886]|uniref:Flagellar protein FliL n=2 Tax=Grimontia hollisae TaxID=673 RepID=D0I494_GRIHO|nr:flagellar biosynthesis protein FliL [Grimontia hollisae CIP 101886]